MQTNIQHYVNLPSTIIRIVHNLLNSKQKNKYVLFGKEKENQPNYIDDKKPAVLYVLLKDLRPWNRKTDYLQNKPETNSGKLVLVESTIFSN